MGMNEQAKAIPPSDANLSAGTRVILAQLAANQRYDQSLSPKDRRKLHEEAFMPLGLQSASQVHVAEFWLPRMAEPLRVRLYRPKNNCDFLPVLLHFHGGGMAVGSLEQYDFLCQRLAEVAGIAIMTVDYALSPEKPFPRAVEDAWFALRWVHANGACFGLDIKRLAVGGDSAGGNLSAVLTIMAREHQGPLIAFQLLIYPAVGTLGNCKTLIAYSEGYLFEKQHLETVYAQYLASPDMLADWRVSPILATSHVRLPKAFILAAECEIMRDDIEDYARLLREAGVDVEYRCYEGMVHPFLSLAGAVHEGTTAIDDCARALRDALSTETEITERG
jgi:acetyl esterase